MPGSLDSCVNSVYEDGNIPASSGHPPVRVLLRDPLEAEILETASAADIVELAALEASVSEAAAAADTTDGELAAAGWALVGSWTHSGNVANVDFTGLAGHSEVRVVIRQLSCGATAGRQLLVSTDNGSTFLSSGTYYKSVSTDGAETSVSSLGFVNSASGSAQSGEIIISGWNLTSIKLAQQRGATEKSALIVTASALNALRVTVASGDLTGGSIYVFAR